MKCFFFICLLAISLLGGCGGRVANQTAGTAPKPKLFLTPQSDQANPNNVIGTWECQGKSTKDISQTYTIRLRFDLKTASAAQICHFQSGKDLSVVAESATLDERDGTQIVLVGGFQAFHEVDGIKCTLDFITGLAFFSHEGHLVITSSDTFAQPDQPRAEKVTACTKVSDS